MKNAGAASRIDLGPLRAQISKVKQSKKARAAQRRRLAAIRAEAARAASEAARISALRAWEAEEKRLEANPKPKVPTRVRFSPNLMVTEIPVSHNNDLPKAVQSPARLEDGPREDLAAAPQLFNINNLPEFDIDMELDNENHTEAADDDEEYTPYSMLFGSKGKKAGSSTRSNPPRKVRKGTPKKLPSQNDDPPSPTAAPGVGDSASAGNKKRKRSSQPGNANHNDTTPPASPSASPSSQLSSSPESNAASPKSRKRRRKAQTPDENDIAGDPNGPNGKALGGAGGAACGSDKTDAEMTEDIKAAVANANDVQMKVANGQPDIPETDSNTANGESPAAIEPDLTDPKTDITIKFVPANGKAGRKKGKGKKKGAAEAPNSPWPSNANGAAATGAKKAAAKDTSKANATPGTDDEAANGNGTAAKAELEDIFQTLKKNNKAKKAAAAKADNANNNSKKRKLQKRTSPSSASVGPRRYTEEGFPIYTEDEIVNDQPKGLNGPCPYDCACCI